jgi:microsomal epoxide hydrolase
VSPRCRDTDGQGPRISKVGTSGASPKPKRADGELGYDRYGAQGGDWGAIATTLIGVVHPEHAIGLHLHLVVAGPPSGEGVNPLEGLSDSELAALDDMNHFREEETGYQAIQGTKPQTLGYGLTDSPAGLAGWIVGEVPHVERLRR